MSVVYNTKYSFPWECIRFTRNANLVASGVMKNMKRVGNYMKETMDEALDPYRKRPKWRNFWLHYEDKPQNKQRKKRTGYGESYLTLSSWILKNKNVTKKWLYWWLATSLRLYDNSNVMSTFLNFGLLMMPKGYGFIPHEKFSDDSYVHNWFLDG